MTDGGIIAGEVTQQLVIATRELSVKWALHALDALCFF